MLCHSRAMIDFHRLVDTGNQEGIRRPAIPEFPRASSARAEHDKMHGIAVRRSMAQCRIESVVESRGSYARRTNGDETGIPFSIVRTEALEQQGS